MNYDKERTKNKEIDDEVPHVSESFSKTKTNKQKNNRSANCPTVPEGSMGRNTADITVGVAKVASQYFVASSRFLQRGFFGVFFLLEISKPCTYRRKLTGTHACRATSVFLNSQTALLCAPVQQIAAEDNSTTHVLAQSRRLLS